MCEVITCTLFRFDRHAPAVVDVVIGRGGRRSRCGCRLGTVRGSRKAQDRYPSTNTVAGGICPTVASIAINLAVEPNRIRCRNTTVKEVTSCGDGHLQSVYVCGNRHRTVVDRLPSARRCQRRALLRAVKIEVLRRELAQVSGISTSRYDAHQGARNNRQGKKPSDRP